MRILIAGGRGHTVGAVPVPSVCPAGPWVGGK